MRVLLPVLDAVRNPFVDMLVAGLEQHGASVVRDSEAFWQPTEGFRVVNVHWPESLFGFLLPSDEQLARLEAVLEQWRKLGTHVILTWHNEAPHGLAGYPNVEKMYTVFYRSASTYAQPYMADASQND